MAILSYEKSLNELIQNLTYEYWIQIFHFLSIPIDSLIINLILCMIDIITTLKKTRVRKLSSWNQGKSVCILIGLDWTSVLV